MQAMRPTPDTGSAKIWILGSPLSGDAVRFQLLDAHRRHRRVAFPLSGVPLKLQCLRPKPYPEKPNTLAEHLRKRRAQIGVRQKDVAALIGVNVWTYLLWERGRSTPTVRYYPTIFRFLGYDPFVASHGLSGCLAAKRRQLGLTIAAAAELLGVDEGTFRRWESGEWKPRMSGRAVEKFLMMTI